MCEDQAADDCDVMNLAAFESAFNDRLAKLDNQFSTISDILKGKKETFIEMYRKNPKISHDEAVGFLQTNTELFDPANPEGELERIEILTQQKTQLENKCQALEQRLNEEKVKNQTLFEAIINLQALEKDLEGQLEEKEVARQNLESENISLEKKWDRRQEDLVQTNDKLVKTQLEKTNLEQRLNELQSSLSGAERRNEELQSALDSEARETSNLEK